MGEFAETIEALGSPQKVRGRPARSAADQLHACIVWQAWRLAEGGDDRMRARYLLQRSSEDDPLVMRSDEWSAHQQGMRSLSALRQAMLATRHPELEDVLRWPLGLLDGYVKRRSTAKRWVSQYTEQNDPSFLNRYIFPGEASDSRSAALGPVLCSDAHGLYERGDAYGFFALAWAFHTYHKRGMADSRWYAAYWMIRALPGLCRDPRVHPFAATAIALTKDLLRLLPDTGRPLHVDDNILFHQINGAEHEPCRSIRLKEASVGRVLPEPDDPVVSYRYVRCRPDQAPMMLAGVDSDLVGHQPH